MKQAHYKIIGVVVPEIVHPFFSDVISGIVAAAETQGYLVVFSQSNESFRKEIRVTQMLHATGVDGLLVCLSNETADVEHLRALQQGGLPLVLFDKVSYELEASTVVTNDFQGAYDATMHLLEQGLRRVAHLMGPPQPQHMRQRLAGYQAALAAQGLPFRPEYVAECQQATHAEGALFARQLLALPEPPEGIFAATDAVAIGALTALKQDGRRVPEDVALIGFSDWSVAALVEPALSSVAQPGYDIGRRAAELLLREIRQRQSGEASTVEHLTLEASLRVRASSVRTVLP